MTVMFCGHADFRGTAEQEQRLFALLEEVIGAETADLYLGGYGGFDGFAYACCKKFKERHPNASLVFVTPYMTQEYQQKHLMELQMKFDEILYPPLEGQPLRFAISYRNQYMVEKADYVIAYVDHDWGGAYTTYRYAKRKRKVIFNLAEFDG